MINCLIVGLGGALGAVARYVIGLLPVQTESGFPVKTLLINIVGGILIGIIAALASENAVNPRLVIFIKVGVCGGFTTFSSFALETEQLLGRGQLVTAVLYAFASVICCVFAVWLGERIIL